MMPPRVFIIDSCPGQEIGGQVQAILGKQQAYFIELISTWFSLGQHTTSALPDLIIPVVSSSDQEKQTFLTGLESQFVNTPLLPIIDPIDLQLPYFTQLSQHADFLFTPLREVEVVIRVQRLVGKNQREPKEIKQKDVQSFGLEQILGEAPAIVLVKRRIPQVARSEGTVLITGETGTGKEIVARTLHYLSKRAKKPFLPVNCGAIPVDLFERELFGHQKGAYTSAWAAQPGLIEEAEGGTLFLDEIETLSLQAQVKLLRFLQDETYHSLGSSKLRQADVWIIASTNVDLNCKIREGSFREDLFYRLAVMTITLPPLRERRTDIPLLANHFLKRFANKNNCVRRLASESIEALCIYAWPGNVRELQNMIRQAVSLSETDTIQVDDFPLLSPASQKRSQGESFRQLKAKAIQEFEKAYIAELLELHNGNVTRAALAAKKERRSFGRLIKKYNLKVDKPAM